MGDWLYNLPIVWMALVAFGVTFSLAAGTCWLVTILANRQRKGQYGR